MNMRIYIRRRYINYFNFPLASFPLLYNYVKSVRIRSFFLSVFGHSSRSIWLNLKIKALLIIFNKFSFLADAYYPSKSLILKFSFIYMDFIITCFTRSH